MISVILVLFNESLLHLNHWTKCFNSLLMTDSIVLISFLLENIILVLSAKCWMMDFLNAYYSSLMYLTNDKGPRVDP